MTRKADPDFILAIVQVLNITDRLLEVADELREARIKVERAIQRAPATSSDRKTKSLPGE